MRLEAAHAAHAQRGAEADLRRYQQDVFSQHFWLSVGCRLPVIRARSTASRVDASQIGLPAESAVRHARTPSMITIYKYSP